LKLISKRGHRVYALTAGDVLAVGVASPAPRVRAGQTLRIEITGVGSLQNGFVAGDT